MGFLSTQLGSLSSVGVGILIIIIGFIVAKAATRKLGTLILIIGAFLLGAGCISLAMLQGIGMTLFDWIKNIVT